MFFVFFTVCQGMFYIYWSYHICTSYIDDVTGEMMTVFCDVALFSLVVPITLIMEVVAPRHSVSGDSHLQSRYSENLIIQPDKCDIPY
jgi:hypothetical protein